MVASRATMKVNPGQTVRDMANNMVKLADEGQWSGAEHVAARLQSAVLEVPEDERPEVMRFAGQCLALVKTRALCSQSDVATKMSEVRRGRDAAKAYGSSLEISRPPPDAPHTAR